MRSRALENRNTANLKELEIPNFTAANMPADGESPRQDGDADGESHLADGDSPRKSDADAPDGDFSNSKTLVHTRTGN